jgi:hypothetical protein
MQKSQLALPVDSRRALEQNRATAMFDAFFTWLEASAFSVWMRESPSVFAFPIILAVHTIGMGFIAGISVALDLRILGFAARIPLAEFRRFWPFMSLGLWLNVTSGLALIAAYPTKALTNPIFYIKLGLIVAALVILQRVRGLLAPAERSPATVQGLHVQALQAAPQVSVAAASAPAIASVAGAKRLAVVSLLCWAGAIASGRFLAYTYIRLMVDSVPVPRPWVPWSY